MQDFRKLDVWRRAHALVLEVYRVTRSFPREEIYGVVSQLRRAAASVAANIAEGSKRRSSTDFGRFLNISQGSLGETEYFLLLSKDLGYLPPAQFARMDADLQPLARMLSSLASKVDAAARPRNAS